MKQKKKKRRKMKQNSRSKKNRFAASLLLPPPGPRLDIDRCRAIGKRASLQNKLNNCDQSQLHNQASYAITLQQRAKWRQNI